MPDKILILAARYSAFDLQSSMSKLHQPVAADVRRLKIGSSLFSVEWRSDLRDRCPLKGMDICVSPFPPPDPQHPQHLGKYEMKLRSNPQQSRNKGATGAATNERGSKTSIPLKTARNLKILPIMVFCPPTSSSIPSGKPLSFPSIPFALSFFNDSVFSSLHFSTFLRVSAFLILRCSTRSSVRCSMFLPSLTPSESPPPLHSTSAPLFPIPQANSPPSRS